VLSVERQGGIVVWTIDRPGAKNALDHAAIGALANAIDDASRDTSVRAAVLTGAGDVFVSGGDLRELRDKTSPEQAERFSELGYHLCRAIGELPFPVIAALPGPAIGGGAELAVACDMRVADVRATIAFRQVRMGVTTAWGTVPRLLALVGAGVASRLLYTACAIGAAEAKACGLVDDVTENGSARTTALAWAAEIADGSPRAIAQMKHLLREATTPARDVRALEKRAFIDTWTGADHLDAVEAYFERRRPRWENR
jgi:enoyl-CoA hydratase